MTLRHQSVAKQTTRSGSTLPELIVALALFGIVGMACLRALSVSARWYERATLVVEQHAQIDAARRLLLTLPAAAAPADGDLLTLGDSSVTWMATVGAAVVCHTAAGSALLTRAPLTSGVDLSSFASTPQPGDALLVLDDGPTPSPTDDRWITHTILAMHSSVGGCVGGPLANPVADASTPAWRVDVAPPISASDSGAPTRILRPQRLALYTSSGEWMLGFTETNGPSGWATIQPAAGPLSSATLPAPGLHLQWLDTLMAPTTTSVSAIGVTLRAPTRRAVRGLHRGAVILVDSLGFTVALHNRL